MGIRIDKYVWAVRLCKTRSQATELIQKNKIKLNAQEIKPSREVNVGDIIQIVKNNAIFSYQIKAILDKRVGAKLVEDYLRDITPEEEITKYKTYQIAQSVYRNNGTGKPSKKDVRDLKKFLGLE